MDSITIADLHVQYRVGVPDAERAQPQRLLLTVVFKSDFTDAVKQDDLTKTINYYDVSRRLLDFGREREWKLIETLAHELAQTLFTEFKPASVSVEVKKFIIPEARYVSVTVQRDRRRAPLTPAQQLMQKIGGVPAGLR